MSGRLKPGQHVIVSLRRMIAAGELKPGERIAEIPTAATLGVSRMPVRTALRALEQEGLVVRLGARGYAARNLSALQIEAAVQVRGVLEGLAARRIAARGPTAVEDAALAACLAEGDRLFAGGLSGGDLQAFYDYNLRFHRLLVGAEGNEAVALALARNDSLPFASAAALAFDWSDLAFEERHLLAAHRQHHEIVAAVRAGDAARAEAVMRDHATIALKGARAFAR